MKAAAGFCGEETDELIVHIHTHTHTKELASYRRYSLTMPEYWRPQSWLFRHWKPADAAVANIKKNMFGFTID